MSLATLYNKIVGISPRVEVFFRKFYWNNIGKTSRFRPKKCNIITTNPSPINFDKIIAYLKNRGIGNGTILIVHSSYDLLESTGLLPEEINSKLLELVGHEGTLVMPVIRKYREEGKLNDYLTKNLDRIICTYNVKESLVISGFLPYALMKRKDSFVSRFPLNPVVAVGKYAKQMVENNLNGDYPSPHGINSAWKYCADNNAIVVGLGVDMPHYLTITHVNEECNPNWPIKDWYRKRKFKIIDEEYKIEKDVLERKTKWGTIYFAEEKYRKDLLKEGILKAEIVEGLKLSIIQSSQLISFLYNHPHKGYPYYVGNKFLVKK